MPPSAYALHRVPLDALQAPGVAGAAARAAFSAALARDHVGLVSLPADADQKALQNLWARAGRFFELPADARRRFGPPHEPPSSPLHCGQSRSAGYTEVNGNYFLDTRLRQPNGVVAAVSAAASVAASTAAAAAASGSDPLASAPCGVEVLPVGLDGRCPGLEGALAAAQQVLLDVGAAALTAAVEALPPVSAPLTAPELQEPAQAPKLAPEPESDPLALIDDAARLAWGQTGASVHRLVRYQGAAISDGNGGSDGSGSSGGSDVLFQAHTDGTWFTVIPVAEVSGLEVFVPAAATSSSSSAAATTRSPLRSGGAAGAWVSPEAQGVAGVDVAVLSGEFLQLLSDGLFSAALHRVVRPAAGLKGRLSAPLLLRASPASGFSGGARDGTLVGTVPLRQAPAAPEPTLGQAPALAGSGAAPGSSANSAAARIAAAKAYAQKKAARGA